MKSRIETINPILNVKDVAASVRYYVKSLGFTKAPWGDAFTFVSRDGHGIYLNQGGQGQPGTWIWIGVSDVEALYEEFLGAGAIVRHPPRNYPWALEMHVADPDGHILRFGSESKKDRPFEAFIV